MKQTIFNMINMPDSNTVETYRYKLDNNTIVVVGYDKRKCQGKKLVPTGEKRPAMTDEIRDMLRDDAAGRLMVIG